MADGGATGLPGVLGLLPATLKTKDGDRPTAEVLAGKDYVNLYFSAHWCPPCKMFTPKLVTFHNTHAASKNFETIFVSADRGASQFAGYFAEMPWAAIDFADQAARSRMDSRLGVEGIPTLAIIDAKDGKVITDSAVGDVMGDAGAASYPYRPLGMWDAFDLEGVTFTNKDGDDVTSADLRKYDYIGVYFSAHWCGPCRSFTPRLISWYAENAEKHNMLIVFASSDHDESSFREYLGTMPWRAIARNDAGMRAINALKKAVNVNGIPHLAFFNKEGKVIQDNARGMVMMEPKGFPWPPKPVESIMSIVGDINKRPAAVLLVDQLTTPDAEMRAALESVARPVFERVQAGDESAKNMIFAVAGSEDPISGQLRAFSKTTGDGDGDDSARFVIFNIPAQRIVVGDKKVYTEADIQKIVDDFISGANEGRPLRG